MADLDSRFELYAVCGGCRRMEPLDLGELARRLGAEVSLLEIRRRLRCSRCRRRTRDMRIVYTGLEGRAGTFGYRLNRSAAPSTPRAGQSPADPRNPPRGRR